MGTATSKPWERQKGETHKAFAAFLVYRDLGPDRTIKLAGKSIGRISDGYDRMSEDWSAKYGWVARAASYDSHLDSIRVAEAARHAVTWERRRLAALDRKWALGQRMMERAAEMLAFPIVEVEEDARGCAITKPSKWTQATAVAMASKGSDMALGASEEATIDQDTFDPLSATLEECQAYIAGKKLKAEAIRKARAEQ